jgi:dihydroorotase
MQISPVQTLFSKGACGFTDDGLPIFNSKIMKNLMEYSAQLGFVVAQHAEDHNLSAGGCVHSGRFAKTFHFKEIDPASEYSVIAKDLALLEDIKNARYHILHVSCKKSLQYIEHAKQKGLNVTSEITPHHFTLTDDSLFENFASAKMNPPLRSEEDVSSMIDGMKKGLIEIIASDHAPHEPSSKEKPVSCASFGIVGLETMLGLSLDLYHKNHLSIENVLKMLTINPAKLIKEDDKRGMIKKNYKADFAIIDENEVWKVDANELKSKSKNTPFNGKILKGRNIMTVCNGEIIFNL